MRTEAGCNGSPQRHKAATAATKGRKPYHAESRETQRQSETAVYRIHRIEQKHYSRKREAGIKNLAGSGKSLRFKCEGWG